MVLPTPAPSIRAEVVDRMAVQQTLTQLAFELKIHAFERRGSTERAADNLQRSACAREPGTGSGKIVAGGS